MLNIFLSMLLPNLSLLSWFVFIRSLGNTTAISFPLLENLKTPLVVQLDTLKIRKYIDTVLENAISNATQELSEQFQGQVDQCVKDALVNVYIQLDRINLQLTNLPIDLPQECNDLKIIRDGVYTIYPADKSHPVQAYCVIEDNKKWTVIQRRDRKTVDFYKTWNEYKDGFGDANGEHWLGNANIHIISTNGRHQIRIKLEDSSGRKAYADYSTFSVGNEASKYILNITGYSGTGGDSMDNVAIYGKANGQRFSTKDQDNDAGSRECANVKHGGWWYSDCEYGDINAKGDVYSPRWLYVFGNVDKSVMMITRSNL